MPLSNFERMVELAEKTFAAKNDPDQLDVDEEVLERFRLIHPATVSEYDDGNGPIAWILLLPTTIDLMNRFLEKKISEKELFYLTEPNKIYDALYLCSGIVLEEYRRKGIAKQLALKAVENIRKDHPIKALFAWAFTKEGDLSSEALADFLKMPLYKRV
jgi:GNAT superfamily N-acetyltransferase